MFMHIKKCLWMGLVTLSILILVWAIGFSLSYIVDKDILVQTLELYALPLAVWRGLLYIGVILAWPWLVKRIAATRLKQVKLSPSRWLLIIVIAAYELLIVQNSVAALVRLF